VEYSGKAADLQVALPFSAKEYGLFFIPIDGFL
jgi:hypothetical protein